MNIYVLILVGVKILLLLFLFTISHIMAKALKICNFFHCVNFFFHNLDLKRRGIILKRCNILVFYNLYVFYILCQRAIF